MRRECNADAWNHVILVLVAVWVTVWSVLFPVLAQPRATWMAILVLKVLATWQMPCVQTPACAHSSMCN